MADKAPAMVWRVGADRTIDWANRAWLDFTGYTMKESFGHKWAHSIHAQDSYRSAIDYHTAFDDRQPFSVSYRLRRFDGEYRWVLDNASPFLRDGVFAGFFGSVTDITDQRNAHDALLSALGQRDHSLGEVYDRVKSNLHQIEGLIALESDRVSDAEAHRALQAISTRVRAMAAVHQRLAKADNLKRIASDELLNELCWDVARSYGAARRGIDVEVKCARIELHVDKAMTLGLAVNELMTNAMRHAFPDNRGGQVRVRFGPSPSGGAVLEVADTGIGLPGGSIDRLPRTGSGIQLVQGFARQLGGRIETTCEEGTAVRIELPC
jgi:PAS domain S-box-containing protein